MRNIETDTLTEIKYSLRLFVFLGIGKAELRRWTKIIESKKGSVRTSVTGMADYVIINPNGKSSITEYEKARNWQRQGRQMQILDAGAFRAYLEQTEPSLKEKKQSRKSTGAFQKLDSAEKQNVAMSWLAGEGNAGYDEAAIGRYIRRNGRDIAGWILHHDADTMLTQFLGLYRKISLVDLDGYIARAKGKPAVSAVLLQYKQQNYSIDQILNADMAREEKAMGLRNLTVEDWKQIYRFITRKDGVVLTEYLGDEEYLEVPTYIGRKPVLGVQPGTYAGKHIRSVNSGVILPLKDYFGQKEIPDLYMMLPEPTREQMQAIDMAKPGDTVFIGHYPSTADGGAQPIAWNVAETDGEDRMMLVAEQSLECLPFDLPRHYSSWNDSALRAWLNGVFLEQAFTETERERILTVKRTNPGNRELGIKGSDITEDRVFLLSIEEMRNLPENACCGCTEYVMMQKRKSGVKESAYWLRSPGGNHRRSAVVTEQGEYRRYGEPIYNSECLVRPAMWIRRSR